MLSLRLPFALLKRQIIRTLCLSVLQVHFVHMIKYNAQRLKDPTLREEIGNLENLTEEKVDKFVEKYLEDIKCGRVDAWPYRAYSVSKIVLNAYTRVLARSVEDRPDGQRIYVNCATPGYCKTDMTKNSGIYTAEEGAAVLVWVALLPPEQPSGQFFAENKAERY